MVINPYRKDIGAKVLASDCPTALRFDGDDLHHTPIVVASDHDPTDSLYTFLRPSSKDGVEVMS